MVTFFLFACTSLLWQVAITCPTTSPPCQLESTPQGTNAHRQKCANMQTPLCDHTVLGLPMFEGVRLLVVAHLSRIARSTL